MTDNFDIEDLPTPEAEEELSNNRDDDEEEEG